MLVIETALVLVSEFVHVNGSAAALVGVTEWKDLWTDVLVAEPVYVVQVANALDAVAGDPVNDVEFAFKLQPALLAFFSVLELQQTFCKYLFYLSNNCNFLMPYYNY